MRFAFSHSCRPDFRCLDSLEWGIRGQAMKMTGGCLCGYIRFTASGAPVHPHSCSCHMCQHHSGAPVLVWVSYPKDAVIWDGPGGAPALWRSSDQSSRAFCPCCGSTLGAVDDAPTIGLVSGAFDRAGSKQLAPQSHSYRSARPRWWASLFAPPAGK